MTTTEDMIIDKVHETLHEILNDDDIFTGEFLARKFWDIKSNKQAEFFNVLANLGDHHHRALQWEHMRNYLTVDGSNLIDGMGRISSKRPD